MKPADEFGRGIFFGAGMVIAGMVVYRAYCVLTGKKPRTP